MIDGKLPTIIQGGMGIGISTWKLAREVSRCGQLGVISGTAIDTVIVRRLQHGDADGSVRRALQFFPNQEMARRFIARYFVEGGTTESQPYALLPLWRIQFAQRRTEALILSSFVETFLAKEGHCGSVGMNLLTKIQLPTVPQLYGAMLAGVDVILMGAGIPRAIPSFLTKLAQHAEIRFALELEDGSAGDEVVFTPEQYGCTHVPLVRPKFYAIVSSHSLAAMLAKGKGDAEPADGFVIEDHHAGGHNAPPRSKNSDGTLCYGERDQADLAKVRSLNLPFWLAGGCASPERVEAARREGAQGVQVGTLFALSQDSGLRADLREQVMARLIDRSLEVDTDHRASPTGYPFKMAVLDETLTDSTLYRSRERICDLGYLRVAYRREDGKIGFRCSAEPVSDYVRKGGDERETNGRICLCNTLTATAGFPQRSRHQQVDDAEVPLVTIGEDLEGVYAFVREHPEGFTAEDALVYLLQQKDGAY